MFSTLRGSVNITSGEPKQIIFKLIIPIRPSSTFKYTASTAYHSSDYDASVIFIETLSHHTKVEGF